VDKGHPDLAVWPGWSTWGHPPPPRSWAPTWGLRCWWREMSGTIPMGSVQFQERVLSRC
jgi:hypothetical protein